MYGTMQRVGWRFELHCLLVLVAVFQALKAASIVVPSSNCYAFDNSSRIVDFTSWIGHAFEYDGGITDLVVRFCKDVESRSQSGYVDFGRFDKFSHFEAGSGQIDFVQGFYNGDLANCEHSYDKLGRTSQVNIICGNCLSGDCRGGLGCICNITYHSTCRVFVELAIPCEKPGPRVFKGFTVGFHPRSWEIVYNGMTQLGFEKSHHEFSFSTEQDDVVLYMTAIASLSTLVQKPVVKVFPDTGLEVSISGSGASGNPPTTLSPTMLIIDWRCERVRDTPYEVNVTIPVEGYEPIQFILSKMCEFRQGKGGDATRGWAVFGVLSCILAVSSTLFCCGGFIYKTRVERQHGIDALPGMTILSACLETVSGAGQSYVRAEDLNNAFASETSWERPSVSAQGTRRPTERKYGAI
ncbi:uncharacterized protein LOC107424562 [Ziziphus jujuba]|uniref:Uncharacterized protein LOC107424562 n=1 Tax=Ziziphus jujuba TaxID=326968 RepID=A0A6P4A6S9_ZIZJJ|nr:uncharacterized protein LOC107424562 [Ziziphus jujuba]XP_015889886.2 uncharacterized protein LOC107424562 [Ziziphus jujuba]XP_015889888.2 uncharacterized protein LOC107424562 [Ziziphus jujuba]XP_060675032.1 uncharacterized protein LOC107424562 [Ziziphus jujuba]